MIQDKNGQGKQLLSEFSMNGVKPKCFMIASAMNNTLEWKVDLYHTVYPEKSIKQHRFSMSASIPDAICEQAKECKIKLKIGEHEFQSSASTVTKNLH